MQLGDRFMGTYYSYIHYCVLSVIEGCSALSLFNPNYLIFSIFYRQDRRCCSVRGSPISIEFIRRKRASSIVFPARLIKFIWLFQFSYRRGRWCYSVHRVCDERIQDYNQQNINWYHCPLIFQYYEVLPMIYNIDVNNQLFQTGYYQSLDNSLKLFESIFQKYVGMLIPTISHQNCLPIRTMFSLKLMLVYSFHKSQEHRE